MAIKQPALILERERRKKKKESEVTPKVNKPTKEVVKNNKGTTHINRATISTKPSTQNTTQNRVLTNKERLTSKPTISNVNKDIRTVKTSKNKSLPKKSIQTVDVYERGGNYYYKDGKKEKQVDTKFIQNALNNNRSGVIGRYNSKGKLVETDERGNVKALEKNVFKKAGRVAKGAYLGAKKGFAGIADAAMQETRNDLQKGEKIDSYGDLAKNEIKALIHAMNPTLGRNAANKEAGKNIRNIWKDEDKTLWQKIVGTGLETINAGTVGDIQGLKESVRGIGAVDHSADEKVKKVQEKIDEPINKQLEKFEQESDKYDKTTNQIAKLSNIVGNMIPGVATSVVTKNPTLGLATMGLSAKGQSTERAEMAGADLDTATKMGTAGGWTEVGTELLTGGVPIFGKGALDDIFGNLINSKIKSKGANFVTKKILGTVGEEFEEVLSDLAGVMIDRGTIDPNAKYTLDDFLETAKDTFGSTFILNLLTGGYGGRAYRSNIADMQNYKAQQANEINQRVQSGEIDDIEGLALLDQVKDGTYQKNRNLEQIATQESQKLKQAAQQGQITPQQYTQELQTLTNTVNQTREEINGTQQENKKLPHSSKVNDVGYHASNKTFESYDISKIGTGQGDNTQGKGINLASVRDAVDGIYGKNTYETNINLENAYTVNDKELLSTFEKDFGYKTDMDNISDELKKKGYDGIVINVNGNKLYTVFDSKNAKITNNQQEITQEQTKEQLPTNTEDKIQNFRNSVANENVEDSEGFYKAVEKIIKDKDYNVILDSSIKDEKGKSVPALISNENGITIRINPKSERAGEILLQHEVTHAVGTQEIIDLIVDYASKNAEFNTALEDLKKVYGTEDVTQEVAADICGQLFGYQEFIDDLSTKNPNLFKRIYEKIVEIANKLTGNSKAELFMRDLKAKWEKAYRNATKETAQQNLKDTVKYSKNAEIRKNFDNEGNKLTKGVQNYFDKSYARVDEKLDGELVMVYHTNKYIDMPFYEFKPQVAPDFHNDLFENQTVIYATDSQKMSGSYAEMEDYVLADTHRYEKIEEVQDFLDQLNEIGHKNGRGLSWTVKDVSNDDYYKDYNKMMLALRFKNKKVNDPKGLYDRGLITKEEYENAITPSKYIIQQSGDHIINSTITFNSKDDLLRNWKNKLSEEINKKSSNNGWEHKGANKERWQYKGYLNIEKPYIVDSQGGNYKRAEAQLKEDVAQSFDKMSKYEKELYDLAQESKRKYREEFLGEKSRLLSNVKRIFNGISNEGIETLLNTGFIGTEQNYNRILEAAENSGIKIPSYDTKVRDITNQATVHIIDEYGDETEKSMLDMSFGDFINYSYDFFQAENDYGSEELWFKKNFKNIIDKDIDADVLNGWSWFKISDKMFNEPSRKDAVYKYLETNDVVAKILRENKNLEEKYDGVIFKNIVDYGHAPLDEHFNPLPYEEWEPATVYVVFNSNQFKAWDNKNPTKDPDMRYSQKADKWQKFLDKYFPERGTRTNLKEKIGAKNTTGQEGEEYWKNNGADTNVAKVLSEVPKDSTKTLMQKVKDGTATLGDEISLFKRKFVDKGEFIYKLAKKAKNRLLYAKFDKMGTAKAEAQFDIGEYQTNLKGKAFKNFVDKDGNKVAMSLNGIWDTVKGFEDAANEYLAHYLNVDRYGKVNEKGRKLQETLKKQVEEGKITQEKADEKWAKANESEIYKYVFGPSVTAEDSKKRIKELEKEHPELKLFGQNIWQYGKNQLLNRVQAGNISQEAADNFMKETPHYVRLQRNVETKGEPAIKFDKNGKATINSQIKEFKGSTADILPFKESMAKYTEETIEAMRKNIFAQELAKTIGVSSDLSTVSSIDEMFGVNPELIKDNGDGTYSLTFFNNGVATTIPINEGIYEALQPNKHFDWEDRLIFKGIRKIDSLRRALLTDKNPMFLATNMMKDLFDAPLNSKYPVAFAKNYIKAIKEISSNGKYFQQYKALGGLQNTYFENGEFKNKNGVKGVASKLDVIGKANNLIEQLPRLAEFITTMEKTGNIDEAMYNAAEITTNFKRGGDITKALNRNGATFLNASVQGFSKQVRNFSDIQSPKQAVQMLAKAVILGIAPALLNDVMYDDDDEYKEMQEYQKDRYYLFKGKNGEWIRIPKGRAISIFQSATRRTKYALKGDKKAYSGLGELVANQVAPNNPFENNIVSPIVDVKRNESWSGNPIVSDSIKNKKHPEEEYTIKTDEFSKWLGKKLHKSPAKINYLIDQYSGALGDITLPNITKNRKRDINNPVDIIANPFKDKFTTNAVTSSKAQNDFYEAFEDAESDKKWSKATAEDEARYKYLYAKNKEISDIRKSIYKMYESNKSTEEKYKYNISSTKEINRIAKEAVENSKKIDKSNKNQIKIGESFYAVSNGKATKVKGETVEKAKEWGIPITDYNDIVSYKYNARADKDANGKSIRGTAKQKVIKYVYSKKDLTEKQKKEIIKRLYKRNS